MEFREGIQACMLWCMETKLWAIGYITFPRNVVSLNWLQQENSAMAAEVGELGVGSAQVA